MTDKSKNLQLEAFNVFKVMVANPRKSKPIFDILVKNRDKLLTYFKTFGLDSQDSTFLDEREFIVQEIDSLPRIISSTTEVSNNNASSSNAASITSPSSVMNNQSSILTHSTSPDSR